MSTNAAARELGYRLTSDSDAPLEKRWISIPQNVWHQPIISNTSMGSPPLVDVAPLQFGEEFLAAP
jgi:hypothetical protein